MKTITSYLGASASVVLAGVVAAAERAGDPSPIYDIPRLEKIVVDGRVEDWGAAGGFKIEVLTTPDGKPKPVADLDPRLRLAWDDRGLLVLVSVNDDSWVESSDLDNLWSQDSVELFLTAKRGAPDQCQWVIAPGMDAKQDRLRWKFYDNRRTEALKKLPAEIKAARVKTDNGYTLEALLPWPSLGMKPVAGQEIGFQVFVNDSDGRNRLASSFYHAVWFPSTETSTDTRKVQRVRLAKRAGVNLRVRASAGYDWDRLGGIVSVVARGEHEGKTVRVVENGKSLASGKLVADGNGYSLAEIRLPTRPLLPESTPFGHVVVELDQNRAVTIEFPRISTEWGEALASASPRAMPSVFSGKGFPKIRFERPLFFEALISQPYTIETTFYDKDYKVVMEATAPGRYGAITVVTAADGRKFVRFQTLFRTTQPLEWWQCELTGAFSLPSELGISSAVATEQAKLVNDQMKWALANEAERSDWPARLIAGLYEMKPSVGAASVYDDPATRDRQWWLGLKRKRNGNDKQFTRTLVCPRPLEGKPAPVLREGTLQEAGMKPDAVETIDAMLRKWEAGTTEAFIACIVRHGVIVHHKAYGKRDDKPMTVTTKSRLASLTKMLSGTLVAMYLDQGFIDLDVPIDHYLPELRGIAVRTPVTIRHLRTHTAGMWGHWGDFDNDLEHKVAEYYPHLQVGKEFIYNGMSLALTCKILEQVEGEALPLLYKKHLLDPLDCKNTDLTDSAAGARSTALDLAKIGQMILNRGAYGNMRFFSEQTYDKMLPEKMTSILGPQTTEVRAVGGAYWSEYKGLSKRAIVGSGASRCRLVVDFENDLVIAMTRNAMDKDWAGYDAKFIQTVADALAK